VLQTIQGVAEELLRTCAGGSSSGGRGACRDCGSRGELEGDGGLDKQNNLLNGSWFRCWHLGDQHLQPRRDCSRAVHVALRAHLVLVLLHDEQPYFQVSCPQVHRG